MRRIPGPAGEQGGENTLTSSRVGRSDETRSGGGGGQGGVGGGGKEEEEDKEIYDTRYGCLQSWRAMCQAFGIGPGLDSFARFDSCKISYVIEGIFDLRVPRIIVLLESAKENFDGSWTLKLSDYSGQIEGFIAKSNTDRSSILQQLETLQAAAAGRLQTTANVNSNSSAITPYNAFSSVGRALHADVVQEFPNILVPGSVLVLEKVPLFVGKEKCIRYLSICNDNVETVFSNQ
jgi:hypothetical protein